MLKAEAKSAKIERVSIFFIYMFTLRSVPRIPSAPMKYANAKVAPIMYELSFLARLFMPTKMLKVEIRNASADFRRMAMVNSF
jgi:hypothetical protein